MDKNSAPLNKHMEEYDNGIIEVMRDVLLIGTNGIESKVLLSNEYVIEGCKDNLLIRNYLDYLVCYMRRRTDDLMAIAKREQTRR